MNDWELIKFNACMRCNSILRVERRKWGNADEREVHCTRSKVQVRSPSVKYCELYASLHDRFRLEVRKLFYPMRTWTLAAWATKIIASMRVVGGAGDGVQVESRVVVRGAAPAGGSRNELKMFHEQILSRNIFFHFATRWTVCTLARIVAGISPVKICCR